VALGAASDPGRLLFRGWLIRSCCFAAGCFAAGGGGVKGAERVLRGRLEGAERGMEGGWRGLRGRLEGL
jgi:hypothetical protein